MLRRAIYILFPISCLLSVIVFIVGGNIVAGSLLFFIESILFLYIANIEFKIISVGDIFSAAFSIKKQFSIFSIMANVASAIYVESFLSIVFYFKNIEFREYGDVYSLVFVCICASLSVAVIALRKLDMFDW